MFVITVCLVVTSGQQANADVKDVVKPSENHTPDFDVAATEVKDAVGNDAKDGKGELDVDEYMKTYEDVGKDDESLEDMEDARWQRTGRVGKKVTHRKYGYFGDVDQDDESLGGMEDARWQRAGRYTSRYARRRYGKKDAILWNDAVDKDDKDAKPFLSRRRRRRSGNRRRYHYHPYHGAPHSHEYMPRFIYERLRG